MFLNLHSTNNNQRLSLNHKINNQKVYSSFLDKSNKNKSYSTSSLKSQAPEFKYKSLSHANSHNLLGQQIRSSFIPKNKNYESLQYASKERLSRYNYSKPAQNLRVNQFKKSYLNLDTKLNKCAIHKDYFKPASGENYQQKSQKSVYAQVQERLKEENIKKSTVLLDEISSLRQQNQHLKIQNQELRKQRSIDLQLIARQNQIMYKQEDLLTVKQEQNYIKKLSQRFMNNNSGTFTFCNDQEHLSSKHMNNQFAQCQQCSRKSFLNQRNQEAFISKIQKMQQQRKLMKQEIHELVYQCEKYKQTIKKLEQKYQKQLMQNQKLIKLIYKDEKKGSLLKYNDTSIDKKPYLNLNHQNWESRQPKAFYQQKQPISLLREERIQKANEAKSELNSPKYKSSNDGSGPKMNTYKSSQSLIKFINGSIESQQEEQIQQYKKLSTEWCNNKNIKKYLEEINEQKTKQFRRIDKLLKL